MQSPGSLACNQWDNVIDGMKTEKWKKETKTIVFKGFSAPESVLTFAYIFLIRPK